MSANYTSQKLVIFTESERVEGTIRHAPAIRVSDYFNASGHRESPFINVCDATVTCLQTGQLLCEGEFVLLARSRVMMVVPNDRASGAAHDQG